jgi:hypothetical protein
MKMNVTHHKSHVWFADKIEEGRWEGIIKELQDTNGIEYGFPFLLMVNNIYVVSIITCALHKYTACAKAH